MRTRTFLFVLLSAISMCVRAQIRSTEACFYLIAGKSLTSSSLCWTVVKFYGNYALLQQDWTDIYSIQRHLKENITYYENTDIRDSQNGWIYKYEPDESTNKYFVYKRYTPAFSGWGIQSPARYEYLAVSKDNSEMLRWWEINGEISNKSKPLIRVDKSEVMPKGVNRDFLE